MACNGKFHPLSFNSKPVQDLIVSANRPVHWWLAEYFGTVLIMGLRFLFLLLPVLMTSCHHPQVTSSWAGSRKSERIALMQTYPKLSPEVALQIYPDIDEALVRASWPKTLNEAVTRLLNDMDEADKKYLRETKQADLINFGFGWGSEIRKEFGLWKGNSILMEDCHKKHPEDASMVIIQAVWQRLQK